MKKSSRKIELQKRIKLLETKQISELNALKNQLEYSYESIKPTHFISNFIEDTLFKPNFLKSKIVKIFASGAGSLIIKNVLVGKNKSIPKKVLGSLIQLFSYKILNNYIK